MPEVLEDRETEEYVPQDPASEEYVPEDDAIIGRAFRGSLWVIVALVVIGGLIFFLLSRPEEAAPEVAIESEAPEQVRAGGAIPPLPFTDVTSEAGITFVHDNGAAGDKLLPETMGGGVAFLDYDGDGDEDLFFVNSSAWPHDTSPEKPATSALYRNDTRPGESIRFTDVSAQTGLDLELYGMGATAADVDADGDLDLFVTAVGPNRLLRNDGGRFVDVTPEAGVAGDENEWSTSAGFFDYDADGDLDLFVCNYVRWSKEIDFELDFRLTGVGRAFGPPQSYEGTHPYLYRNEGGGKFTDVTEEAGLQIDNPATGLPMAKALALLPIDVDGDGFLDLLVANDTVQNFFFHNLGDGTFEEAGEFFGVAYDRNGNATGAMGIDAAYHRNDHNLGFFIGNFANEMSSVYVAQDDPVFFVDESITEGIGAPSRLMLTFGVFLFDVDLDGRLDLFQANGHIEDEIEKVDPSQKYRQPSQIFWNGGEAGFLPVPPETTGDLAREIVGRGAAYADLDKDGDLEVVVTQIAGPPLLLRNDQSTGHHWLRVELEGEAPNTAAIGAWVEVTAGGVTQRRQVMPVRSYLSRVEPAVTFGLGEAEQIEELKIHWPDGTEQGVEGAEVDTVRFVSQG